MPIDSKFTLPGFYGDNVYSNLPLAELAVYKDILLRSYKVLKRLNGAWSGQVKQLTELEKLSKMALIWGQ
jgi:hypothetical protein